MHLRQLHADRCHGVDLQFAAFKDGDCTLADIGADADDWPLSRRHGPKCFHRQAEAARASCSAEPML
uniref:Uncharacterized protein n=2 Tax=Pseudomonas TaxID=286 RepID=A0A7S6C7H0_PSEAI|nr:hypothetical protein [Pseudomonas monteilii]QLG05034.1 hypothetical protein [Pseudomonas aeruginosa]QNI17640.1 hypothetical protein [Pseudomonas aeruginosa]